MINKQIFTINQQAFPFIKKSILTDLDNNKIKIKQRSLFKSDEIEIDIDRVNPNIQKIRRLALPWLFISLAISVYLTVCLTAWLWRPPLTLEDFGLYIVGQVALLLVVSMTWLKFFNNSYNLTLFFDRYNNSVAFSLCTNKPDGDQYDNFVETLQKVIVSRDQTRSIQSILSEIPTHILVEEFSSSYIDELSRRGIEVSTLLSFLQKRAVNTQDATHRS